MREEHPLGDFWHGALVVPAVMALMTQLVVLVLAYDGQGYTDIPGERMSSVHKKI